MHATTQVSSCSGPCRRRDQSSTDAFKWKHAPSQHRPPHTQKKRLNPTICHSTVAALLLILHSESIQVELKSQHKPVEGTQRKTETAKGKYFCFRIIKANDRTQKWFFFPADHWQKWPTEGNFVVVLMPLVWVWVECKGQKHCTHAQTSNCPECNTLANVFSYLLTQHNILNYFNIVFSGGSVWNVIHKQLFMAAF